MRKTTLTLVLAASFAVAPTLAEAAGEATLYKDPNCGCCENYGRYLEKSGFTVTVVPTDDLAGVNERNGVADELAGCHTTVLDGYVFSGHVPVALVNRVLTARPVIKGITLPGMPAGSPGMFGDKEGAWTFYAVGGEAGQVYAVE